MQSYPFVSKVLLCFGHTQTVLPSEVPLPAFGAMVPQTVLIKTKPLTTMTIPKRFGAFCDRLYGGGFRAWSRQPFTRIRPRF